MNINAKIILRKDKVYKDQTSPLFIRLIQKKQTKFIAIGVNVNPVYCDFECSVLTDDCPERERIQQRIDAKTEAVNRQIAKFKILEIEPVLESFGEPRKNRFNPLIRECFQRYIATLRQAGKINTSIKYAFTLSSLNVLSLGSISVKVSGWHLRLKNTGRNRSASPAE